MLLSIIQNSCLPKWLLTLALYIHAAASTVIPSSTRNNTSSLPARDIPFFPLIPDVPAGWVLNDLDSVQECSSDDPENPSQECFQALDVRAQGYMWISTKTCTTIQNQVLTRAFRHAYTIISASKDFPTKDSHQQAAAYYMGPDWETDEYKNRLIANINRAVTFHSDTLNNYITLTCNDSRNQCGKQFNGKSVGGYAYTKTHWLWWDWHYINMCDLFFTGVKDFDNRVDEIRDDVGNGNYQYADDASWLQTTGSYLVHEMMHSKLIDNSPPDPHITDEPVDPDQPGKGKAAYMPYFVRMLAKRKPERGGGAKRASTNADSYTQMMNAIYWNSITGHLPIVPNSKTAAEDQDEDPNQMDPTVANDVPVMVDLGTLDSDTDVGFEFDVKSAMF